MNSKDDRGDGRRRSEKIGDFVSIFQRGQVWWMNYQDPDGQQIRRSLKTTSKKQAKQLALRKDGELLEGRDSLRVVVATIDEAIAAYDAYLVAEGRAPKTLSKYRLTLQRVADLATRRRVKDMRGITLPFVDAFRKERHDAGAAIKTIHLETTILRQLVNFALSREMVDFDRLKGLKLKRPKPTPQPCWTFEQVEQILAAVRGDPYAALFGLLAHAGLRIAEAKYLEWDDVDFTNGVLRIRAKVINAKTGQRWQPKSGDQRAVPMGPPVVAILRGLPQSARWVFTTPSRQPRLAGEPIDDRRALYHLKKALKALGLPGHLHTFRHSLISHALVNGVPEAVVRRWAGHVDPEILKLYTHIADADSKAHMDRLFARPADQTAEPAAEPRTNPEFQEGASDRESA